MIIETQTIDLLVSHHQITVQSRDDEEKLYQWGKKNIEQGAVIHPDYVTFDPLPDEAFGANVLLILSDDFEIDARTARAILVPFLVTDRNELALASAGGYHKIELNLDKSRYKLYFEVAEESDAIFYKFTFVESDEEIVPIYLMNDNWGGEKGKELVLGYK